MDIPRGGALRPAAERGTDRPLNPGARNPYNPDA